jgi:hypothetical protein
MYAYDKISLNCSQNEKFFRQKIVEQNQSIHLMFNTLFLLKKYADYEIMW